MGILCQQAVQISILQGGLDFNKLVWALTTGYSSGGLSSGGAANSYHGAIAVDDAIVLTGTNDGWANQASMHYTGPATACQVKITFDSLSGGNASAFASVVIWQDGVQILNRNVQSNQTVNFNVAAGNNSFIQIGMPPTNPVGSPGINVGCDIIDFPGPNFEGVVTFEFLPHS